MKEWKELSNIYESRLTIVFVWKCQNELFFSISWVQLIPLKEVKQILVVVVLKYPSKVLEENWQNVCKIIIGASFKEVIVLRHPFLPHFH